MQKLFGWVESALNLKTIVEKVNAINKRTIEIRFVLTDLVRKFNNLEIVIMTLAEKIASLVAVEIEEGKEQQEQNAKLNTALTGANEKIAALEARIAELEALAASVPELQATIDGLKSDLAAAKSELADASAAADAIAAINPTPFSDAIVDEVKENPEIETPVVVEEAPAPTTDTIPELPVVEEAIDALDSAD